MPMWVFHHTKGSFTREDKLKLGQAMSNIYITFLPAFYAHVHFFKLGPDESGPATSLLPHSLWSPSTTPQPGL
ncbi:hypothetical protein GGR53DRAFT_513717 [Hypoxylon sp. FL1150]|nr:hypothetical protein GGR53DRAFT_513717 [Hypoxylon sp. FL1150]